MKTELNINFLVKLGDYLCSRCNNTIYRSTDKWVGPCVWPSFRNSANDNEAIHYLNADGYNNYKCRVDELYCKKCLLFIGHRFEDGIEKGKIFFFVI